MRMRALKWAMALAMTVGSSATASTILNVDIQGDSNPPESQYTGASPVESGGIWNHVTADALPGLLDSTGTPTTIGINMFGALGREVSGITANPLLMDYLYRNSAGFATVEWTGLRNDRVYDAYVYTGTQGGLYRYENYGTAYNHTAAYTNPANYNPGPSGSGDFVEGENYVKIGNIVSGSGTATMKYSNGQFAGFTLVEREVPDVANQVAINGLQVFDRATQAVHTRPDAANAIDGLIGTNSYLTPSGTVTEQVVALDIDPSHAVNRLRVAKIGDIDGVGNTIDSMNLQILYTTDTGPLNERTYLPVTSLTNGWLGTELIQATSVDSLTATVLNDTHDFTLNGFYSLTFDAVNATAIAIAFTRAPGEPYDFVHYNALEFQVVSVPEPSSIMILAFGSVALLTFRRKR